MSKLVTIEEQLRAVRALTHGWDGYQGLPIKEKAIQKALEIVKALPGNQWQLIPSPDGNLQLESHSDVYDIEIFINALNEEALINKEER